ncbi:MAG: indole-3-glycerol phosphate synthase TrpC [Saprospiraceae bacterium]
MTILNKIVEHKKGEVSKRKELYPTKLLEQSIYFDAPCVSMKKYLQRPDKSGIIAEFKRASPSKGSINPYASVEKVTIGYMQAGASALSVLTDEHFFKGKNADLQEARKFNYCPILRKDFIIDEYQLYEARSIGADVILLIAECLDRGRLKALARKAQDLGMEVLMEVHSEEQLSKANEFVDIIGVNNRNLHDFSVSIQTSIDLFSVIPNDFVKISESGISDPNAIIQLKEVGFQGFLIGEYFMQADEPHRRCQEFIARVNDMEMTYKHGIA